MRREEKGRKRGLRLNVFVGKKKKLWHGGLGLTGVEHRFYASSWPNVFSSLYYLWAFAFSKANKFYVISVNFLNLAFETTRSKIIQLEQELWGQKKEGKKKKKKTQNSSLVFLNFSQSRVTLFTPKSQLNFLWCLSSYFISTSEPCQLSRRLLYLLSLICCFTS